MKIKQYPHTAPYMIRQICQYLFAQEPMSFREIARINHISHHTVMRVHSRISNISYECIAQMSDNELAQHFYPAKHSPTPKANNPAHPTPDWIVVHMELQKKNMTLILLWEEYRQKYPDGISYTQFCRKYRKWLGTIKVSMRQTHHPGEKIFIDFCGQTMEIRDKITGRTWKAQIFVAVLGSSGYIFAIAVINQTTEEFLYAHVKMFEHLGGVSQYVVPDNLKAAVLKHNKKEIVLNPAYQELAEHYHFVILPARPYKPKDKSMAELGVKIVQRYILARLRNSVFFSLEELNQQLAHWLHILNHKTTRTYKVCRAERLKNIDQPHLQALPAQAYEHGFWLYQQRVDETYHVRCRDKYYSVPYQYAYQLVDSKRPVNSPFASQIKLLP